MLQTQLPSLIPFNYPALQAACEDLLNPRARGKIRSILEMSNKDAARSQGHGLYRELFDGINQGFCVIKMLFEKAQPVDYRFLVVNAPFEEQTGLYRAQSKRALELVPDLEPLWVETYGRMALTGEPYRFENHAEAMNRWFDVYAFRVSDPNDHHVAVFFRDISKQRHAEHALEALTQALEAKVHERTGQIRDLAAQLTLAEAREQARLAQLLHDDLQQQLYAVAFALRGLRSYLEGDETALGQVQKIKGLLDDAVATSRTTTAHLSPPVLRHEGLSEALKWLGNDMAARYDLHVIVELPTDLIIPNEATQVLLFNMARELLFNVVKHAGVAEATLTLGQDSEHFSLIVRDFGSGFDKADKGGTGLGHQEMRQRLNLFGGRLELSSTPGEGTQATISLQVAHFSLG